MHAITEPFLIDAEAARKKIESVRWPNGPVCPHCQEADRRYATKKEGRWRCGNPACRKDYTVTTGTVMESSHIPLHKWLMAFYLLSSSKKGISSHQLMRSLSLTYKSAWFLSHRVREAMRAGGLAPPMGGDGGVVEMDEVYHGKVETPVRLSRGRIPKPTKKGRSGPAGKRVIISLVEHAFRVQPSCDVWGHETKYASIELWDGQDFCSDVQLSRPSPSAELQDRCVQHWSCSALAAAHPNLADEATGDEVPDSTHSQ